MRVTPREREMAPIPTRLWRRLRHHHGDPPTSVFFLLHLFLFLFIVGSEEVKETIRGQCATTSNGSRRIVGIGTGTVRSVDVAVFQIRSDRFLQSLCEFEQLPNHPPTKF